jgi:nucleoside-diphosphate-sugar epimerase
MMSVRSARLPRRTTASFLATRSARPRRDPPGDRTARAVVATPGVHSSVLSLPPTVHGDAENGFIAIFVAVAREKGVAGYVGDGSSRWPAVHRSDAARLARLAVEAAPAGSVLHAAGEESVPFREIAEAMSCHLNVPTESVAPEKALEHIGPLGLFAGLDSPASVAITRELMGWEATGPTLLEDLAEDHYYREA